MALRILTRCSRAAQLTRLPRAHPLSALVRHFSGFPDDRKYTVSHEWIETKKTAKVGISDFAQDALGDVVFVDLPDVGAEFSKSEAFAAVESVKSSNDIYAPVSGTVVAVNEALEDEPELLNSSAHGEGWIAEFEISDAGEGEMDDLLDSAAYTEHVQSED